MLVTWWAWTGPSTTLNLTERVKGTCGTPDIGHEVRLLDDPELVLVVVNVEWDRTLSAVKLGFGGVDAQTGNRLRQAGWQDHR